MVWLACDILVGRWPAEWSEVDDTLSGVPGLFVQRTVFHRLRFWSVGVVREIFGESISMVKKFTASREQLKPDTRFNSMLVSKFVNCLMYDGKKSVALSAFYRAMDQIGKQLPEEDPLRIFEAAVENVKPAIEVRSKRVGGATYQVPTPVNPRRQQALSIRWILEAVRGRKGRPVDRSLADELLAAFRREGTAMTKRENVHRMAEANKAFSHFAW